MEKRGDRLKTGFIGAGKVGFTLGKFFCSNSNSNSIKVTGYYSRNTQSAEEAAKFTETEAFDDMGAIIEASDVLFLTVPDGAITEVYEQVRQYPIQGKYICHCSGSLSSGEAFPGIDQTGAYEYSVHPLFAVSDKFEAYKELQDVFFTIEGNEEHLPEIEGMLRDAGLDLQVIRPEDKTLYHAAAVTASNLVVALLAESIDMLRRCGFDEADARRALTPLVLGNVKHVLAKGPAEALTGPVERGDEKTIAKHLVCLSDSQRELYRVLSSRLIPVAEAKHPDRLYQNIREALEPDLSEEDYEAMYLPEEE
ncbi:MAG: Rossmann-like and DUF2520 domain-containing protein [Bacillota bacterium]